MIHSMDIVQLFLLSIHTISIHLFQLFSILFNTYYFNCIPSIAHLHCICAGPVLRHRPQPLRRGRQGGPVSAFAPRPRRSAAVRGLKRRDPKLISTENRSSLEVPSGKLTFCYGKSPCFNGKIHYKSPFSIAMLNYQRVTGKTNNNRDDYSRTNKNKMISFGGIPNSRSVLFLQVVLQRAAKPSARNTSAGFPWVKWPPCPPPFGINLTNFMKYCYSKTCACAICATQVQLQNQRLHSATMLETVKLSITEWCLLLHP